MTISNSTYAVIPAAGRGTRLGANIPKILLPITETQTVWTILRNKLIDLVDHIHLVVSPHSESLMRAAAKQDIADGIVSIGIQPQPIGMGDAIFQTQNHWRAAKNILIVWGDQAFVSKNTLQTAITKQNSSVENQITLPLVKTNNPYVEYIFSENKLLEVKQQREGDTCNVSGLADVGTFVLSVNNLVNLWNDYQQKSSHGCKTNEINFLPFLVFLQQQNWKVNSFMVNDIREARGINTQDDLAFFKELFAGVEA